MLGEIDFKAWQCLCEIIDNSIDSFSSSDALFEAGGKPSIKVKLPGHTKHKVKPADVLVIEDNGAGMTFHALSKSLKAGFSGNNPIDKMGLFGMGFNIATARLGHRTEVITSTKDSDELLKVVIDFQALEEKKHFFAPVERVPKKADEKNFHGTIIKITKLRVDHVKPLYQQKKIREKLGKIYGRILREKEIKLVYHSSKCRPFKHCTWSEQRNGLSRNNPVSAIKYINQLVDNKLYCSTCWVWLNDRESECPSCNDSESLSRRKRSVKGWIGIQRYFDANHYGIDLIRNGRVIKELDKSLFYWENREQDMELEYPIDGHQRLGRIVGELEIDFVKVTHQKDAFETNSQDWRDVILAIRGDGPIRPQIAKSQGYVENTSPLAQLFSAFRTAKAGVKNLVPQRKNGQAMITDSVIDELVKRFNDGETDYQNDEKWWELLNETAPSLTTPDGKDDPTGGNPFDVAPSDGEKTGEDSSPADDSLDSELNAEPDTDLSRNYSLDLFKNISIRVIAERVMEGNHKNGFEVVLKGVELQFRYWEKSPVFCSTLLRPADCLINELAYHMHSIAQNEVSRIPITAVELALREKYFPELHPTIDELYRQVSVFSDELMDHLRLNFNTLKIDTSIIKSRDLTDIKRRMAQNEYLDDRQADEAIGRGEFMSYAPFHVLKDIVIEYPELVFDGTFFNQIWSVDSQTSPIMSQLKSEMHSLMEDVNWFIKKPSTSGNDLWRGRVKRLVGSLEILINWRV